MKPTFSDAIGAGITIVAVVVIAYAAAVQNNDGAMTALVGVVGAGVGYFLRGKVQSPGGPGAGTAQGGQG